MEAEIYSLLAERLREGGPAALATVVRTWGSTPQSAGAKAIFTPDGGIAGTIGGGCLEHEVRLAALDALCDHRPRLMEVRLDADADQDTGLICGGRALVFVALPEADQAELLEWVAGCRAASRAVALATQVSGEGAGRLAAADDGGEVRGHPGLAVRAREALRNREPGLVETETGQVYVDLLLPRQRLWIAGAGHVGRALARHASEVEFEVHVVDDRPDLNSPANIPHATEHRVGDIETELARLELGPEDYVVVVTRGHRDDLAALRAVGRSGARYLGMIGSRRKIKLIRETLVEAGEADETQLDRVFAPIGLDLGAVTVDEIAVAITAELIAVRRGVLSSPGERWVSSGKRQRGAAR